MRNLLSILILLIGSTSFSQQFVPNGEGIIFQSKEGVGLNKGVFEACWCNPVMDDSTQEIVALSPIVYPVPVQLDNEWLLMEKDGSITKPLTSEVPYLKAKNGYGQLFGFYHADHQWSLDSTAKIILNDSIKNDPITYVVKDLYKGTFLASPDKYFWGLLNSELKEIVKFEYASSHHSQEDFHFSSKGYMTLRENKPEGYNGIVDYKGKVHVSFKWRLLSYVVEDEKHIYAMREDRKRGYIDINENIVLPFIFDKIPREISDSNFVETEKYKWFIDRNFKQIGPKYQAFEKKGDLYFFKKDNKWGVMNASLETIIPNIYTSIMDGPRLKSDPDFKCYIVVKNGLYGLTTLTGESIIKPGYECLCGLSYYAPDSYYIEFKKANVSYKFNEKGELVEKGGKGSKACFCE